jgi:hypothetical protein
VNYSQYDNTLSLCWSCNSRDFVTSVAFLTFFWVILRLFAIICKIWERMNKKFWNSDTDCSWFLVIQFSWLTSIVGVMPLSSSLYCALRIKDNLSWRWVGNLNVLEFSIRALEIPCQHKNIIKGRTTVVWQI